VIITKHTPFFQSIRVYDADGRMLTLGVEIDTDKQTVKRYIRPVESFEAARWPWPTETVPYARIEVRPRPSDKAAAIKHYAGIPNLTIGDPLL
jgi:hypothetical protein